MNTSEKINIEHALPRCPIFIFSRKHSHIFQKSLRMSTFALVVNVADSCSRQTAIATFCAKDLIDKSTFGNLLGINRRTLGRWESGVINKIARLRYYYYGNGSLKIPKKPPLLDGYRRLVLCAIAYRRMARNNSLDLILEEFETFSTDDISREAYELWVNTYLQNEG